MDSRLATGPLEGSPYSLQSENHNPRWGLWPFLILLDLGQEQVFSAEKHFDVMVDV